MSDGEIQAWHYSTRQTVCLRWRAGRITALERVSTEPPPALWLAPPLFDAQVNGYAGVDFQRDGLTEQELLLAARQLRLAGCTRFLLTLITDEWGKLMARLGHLRAIRSRSAELQSAIAGWHIEGPFLSAEPGFRGAHNPDVMVDPSPQHMRELREITQDDPVLLTVAPERQGAIEAIALAVSLGIKVSVGHSNASAEVLRQAVQAGVAGFTHLGNACPQQLDRHDNILWRVLDTSELTVGVIPDRIHVSPALFRLIHRVRPASSIYYTTDAMSAAGAAPGRYTIGALTLEVGEDQIVRQPGKTNFAGSALRPIDGVFRAARMLDRSWREVWDAFSWHPARFIALPRGIEIGAPADFCLVKVNEQNEFQELRVWINGVLQNSGLGK
ncbi:MAG: N-acetylglucosamine-6-phosphate deacetylase [Verrucomicrobia bacterium]|nr:N-acetylglucosamine-6-phosphate deacetylase [Verrucomicrobiota bacterium]